jgi:hypothetical protein
MKEIIKLGVERGTEKVGQHRITVRTFAHERVNLCLGESCKSDENCM